MARIYEQDRIVAEAPLRYSGEVSVFEGEFAVGAPGQYRLQVVASQPQTQNFGMTQLEIVVK